MLILTRKTNESFMVGDEVKITVLDIRESQVRLGIEAPDDISIHRSEIYQKTEKEK